MTHKYVEKVRNRNMETIGNSRIAFTPKGIPVTKLFWGRVLVMESKRKGKTRFNVPDCIMIEYGSLSMKCIFLSRYVFLNLGTKNTERKAIMKMASANTKSPNWVVSACKNGIFSKYFGIPNRVV